MDINEQVEFERKLHRIMSQKALIIRTFSSMVEVMQTIAFTMYVDSVGYQMTKETTNIFNSIKITLNTDYSIEEFPELWI